MRALCDEICILKKGLPAFCKTGERHCVGSLFSHAGLFRNDIADRGHAARDAEDRPRFSIDAGTYDDEEYIFEHQSGQFSAADLCHDGSHRPLYSPCGVLFPLGIKIVHRCFFAK